MTTEQDIEHTKALWRAGKLSAPWLVEDWAKLKRERDMLQSTASAALEKLGKAAKRYDELAGAVEVLLKIKSK